MVLLEERWLDRLSPDRLFSMADRVAVVSRGPLVLGNQPERGQEAHYEKVALLGQVKVNVRGKVRTGDYIVPSGRDDGTGRAISAADMTLEQSYRIVGQAWEPSEASGVKRVNTLVSAATGFSGACFSRQLRAVQEEIGALRGELAALRQGRQTIR